MYVGSKFGLTFDEFREAFHLFSESRHSPELRNVRDGPLPDELIVCGFIKDQGCNSKQTLFRSHRDWSVEQNSKFYTIGDDSLAARLSLLARGVGKAKLTAQDASYVVFEAKRFSESTPSVAKQTSLTVYMADGSERRYDTEGYLSYLYAKFGPQPLADMTSTANLFEGSDI